MSRSLAERIGDLARAVLGAYPGAWMVWCDPRGDWAPLLERAAAGEGGPPFALATVTQSTGAEAGSPLERRLLQERLDRGESFVLLVRAAPDRLGWLWAQALGAERTYARSLRDQALEWGWRPQSLTIGDDELAAIARQNIDQDPVEWGGGGLKPDRALLVRVLAGVGMARDYETLVLTATVDATGLPALDADALAALDGRADRVSAGNGEDDGDRDEEARRRCEGALSLWRTRALARLLVTQAYEKAPGTVGEAHELLIAAEKRHGALALLDDWDDSVNLRKRLAAAVTEADGMTGLGSLPPGAPLGAAPLLSRAAEGAALAAWRRSLTTITGVDLLVALAARCDDLRRHADGFWGEDHDGLAAIPWAEAARLADATRLLLDASPAEPWPTPAHAISWYVEGGWHVDRAGDELLRELTAPSTDLVALLPALRDAYRNRWEDLLIRWSDVWSAAGCPTGDLPSAGAWLKEALKTKEPTAVVVIDALRYDLGATIAERVNAREGATRATVSRARAPLPSVTALGMGMALPLDEGTLDAELVAGSWALRRKGEEHDLSTAVGRRAWWAVHGGVGPEGHVALTATVEGAVPSPSASLAHLVVHDDALDQLGHDDELETLGAEPVLGRYVRAVEALHQAGWRRILMVTDHGYIHWSGTAERQVAPPAPAPLYTTRRALAYPAETELPMPRGLSPRGRYAVALSSGAACFKTYGGLGYFHGGASLQEWVIPCVRVEWPARAVPVGVTLAPLAQILNVNRVRVTLTVTKPSLLAEHALARRVDVVVRTVPAGAILFRSVVFTLTPDKESATVILAPTTATAPRRTPVAIEVRDALDEAVIASGESVLMVDKDEWTDPDGGW